jgi:hypothetical protein
MPKFSLKADHFITPIKLVLPGIIVSLIGASAGYYIFNNPKKNKAKATYSTWNVIRQFEQSFEENADLIPCRLDTFDQVQFRKDYLHLLEMTRQNILDLKNDDNIDKRLTAIINLKIDSYNETKKISENFLDSFVVIKNELGTGQYTPEQELAVTSYMQQMYFNDLIHISNRDTAVITSILNDLTKSYADYVDSFKVEQKIQPVKELQTNVIGKWFTTDKVSIDIKKDSNGHWKQEAFETDFTWKFDTSMIAKDKIHPQFSRINVRFPNGSIIPFEIIKATPQVFAFYIRDGSGNFVYSSACRQSDAK